MRYVSCFLIGLLLVACGRESDTAMETRRVFSLAETGSQPLSPIAPSEVAPAPACAEEMAFVAQNYTSFVQGLTAACVSTTLIGLANQLPIPCATLVQNCLNYAVSQSPHPIDQFGPDLPPNPSPSPIDQY